MLLAVGWGARGEAEAAAAEEGSGETGEGGTLPEGVRRGGATPLEDWRDFMEAFRRRVGVAERESRVLVEDIREAERTLRADGDRSMAGRYEAPGERAGTGWAEAVAVAVEGEVDKESLLRERTTSSSCGFCAPPSWCCAWAAEAARFAGVVREFGGDGMMGEGSRLSFQVAMVEFKCGDRSGW